MPSAEVYTVRRTLTMYGVISLLLSAALLFGTGAMFMSLFTYRNPYPVRQDFAASGRGPALTQHVLLVVVDGLRSDTAKTMRAFRPDPGILCRTGELSVSQPSYSLPTWAVIGTGTTQAVTGVVLNGYRQPTISNIFAKAKTAGLTTAMVGGVSWNTLYGPWFDEKYVFPGELAETEIASRAADMAATASLTLAYFPRTDAMAHEFGAASQQYAEAARAIDNALQQLLESVDLTTTTVIITSDHGQLKAGGHGGPEPDVTTTPLAIYGAAVKAGPALSGREVDIAPTVAALLGTGFPDFVQGEPLLDAISCDTVGRELITAAWAAQVEKGTVALLPALDAVVKPVGTTNTRQRAEAFVDQYTAAVAAKAAADMWNPARWGAYAAVLMVSLLISVSLRRYSTRTTVLGAVAGLAASAALAFLGPLRPTFSTIRSPLQYIGVLTAYAVAGLAVVLVLAQIGKWRGRPVLFRYWAFGMIQAQIVVFGLALALHALRGPFLVSGYMPDFGYWLLKTDLSAYAGVANIVLLAGLVPLWLICRTRRGDATDSPTLVAPRVAGGHRP